MESRERRTVLGIDCLFWALVCDLSAVVATFAVSTAVVPGFLMALQVGEDPGALMPHLPCMLVYVSSSAMLGLSAILLFFVGFHDLYLGRREFGANQERHVFRARVFLVATVILGAVFVGLPRYPGMVVGFPEESLAGPDWALGARVVVSGLVALFAGLTLMNAVYGLADHVQQRRLRTAVGLGVTAAVAGSAFGVVGILSGTVGLLMAAVVAGAIAGEGTAAISLVLFLLVLRDIRRDLRSASARGSGTVRRTPDS